MSANSFPQLHHPIIFTSSKKISYVLEHSLRVRADIAILNKLISRHCTTCSRPSAMPSFRLALIMWTQHIQFHIYRLASSQRVFRDSLTYTKCCCICCIHLFYLSSGVVFIFPPGHFIVTIIYGIDCLDVAKEVRMKPNLFMVFKAVYGCAYNYSVLLITLFPLPSTSIASDYLCPKR